MFSKNLKFYRLRKQMSKKELADKVNISPMAITNYENGDRKPNMEILQKLADILDVRVSDFLAVRNENIIFAHGEFRKNASLSAAQLDLSSPLGQKELMGHIIIGIRASASSSERGWKYSHCRRSKPGYWKARDFQEFSN